MTVLTVEVPNTTTHYPLKIEKGLMAHVAEEIKNVYTNKKIVMITDTNVHQLYGAKLEQQLTDSGFEVKLLVLEAGEQTKSITSLMGIYSELTAFNLTRSDLLIALGGGVIGDLVGYAAATYLRGIAFVQIPTTLLAQVDSSVGGKVAIDLPEGKNLVGAFYHPILVLIDPNVLQTLTDSAFNDGMAEVIKYASIQNINFFHQLASYQSREAVMAEIEQVIEFCCSMKRDLVQADEKDTSERMLLNYGHTVGHAIEAFYHYKGYTHGQAISIGMVAINRLTEAAGISRKGSTALVKALLEQYHLPTELADPADYADILPLIKLDKKNIHNTLNVVVLNEVGAAKLLKTDSDFFGPLLKGHDIK